MNDSKKNAKRFLKDLEEVIEMIHDRCGYEVPALGLLNHAVYVKQAK